MLYMWVMPAMCTIPINNYIRENNAQENGAEVKKISDHQNIKLQSINILRTHFYTLAQFSTVLFFLPDTSTNSYGVH